MTEEMTAPTTEQEVPTTEHDVDLSQGFLGEDTDIPTEEVSEDKPDEEPVQKEAEPEEKKEAEAPFLTVKFNKEARDLTHDEAVELAQKGLNYDTVYERYNALKQYEGIGGEITKLAEANGMSVKDYLDNLRQVQEAFELNKEVENLKKTYGDADETLVNELAKYHINERRSSNEKAAEQQVESEKSSQRAEIERQVNKFQQRYPDVDPSKLDKEVYALMRENYTLLESYEIVQADKRAAEDRIREKQALSTKQNEENKKKSLGNINTTGEIEKNAFMEAFLSDD